MPEITSRLSTALTAALILMVAAACRGEQLAEPELPDISGTWDFSLVAFPTGTQGDQGRCELQPITLELTQLRSGARHSLDGVHAAADVVCSDITELANPLSGDTTIQFEAGTVTGWVSWFCDAPAGWAGFGKCPVDRFPWVDMSFLGQRFYGEIDSSLMSGDFAWTDISPNVVHTFLYGTWSAHVNAGN